MTELSGRLEAWRLSGDVAVIDGVPIWHRADGAGPWLVCLHGFPTSSRDYLALLPLLQGHYRVLIFDLPGFGLSGKPAGRDYSLVRQFEVMEGLLASLGIERFHLLAHDMGDSLACELLRRAGSGDTALYPETLSLLNGGLYMDLHRPLPTQRLLRVKGLNTVFSRLASYRVFRHQYQQVYADSSQFDEEHYEEQWRLMCYGGGRRVWPQLAGYMNERVRMGERWLQPLRGFARPLQLIWGLEDRIAVPAIAERLAAERPGTTRVSFEGVGHYPQLEAPERVAAAVVRFVAQRENADT